MTKKDVEKVVNAFSILSKEPKEGNKVQLIGFGTFEVRNRQAVRDAILRREKKSTYRLPEFLLLRLVKP